MWGITNDASGNIILSGTGGVFRGPSAGSTDPSQWTYLYNSGGIEVRTVFADHAGNLYFGSQKNDPTMIYRSTDQGQTWQVYNSGIPSGTGEPWHFLCNSVDGFLYTVLQGKGVWRTIQLVCGSGGGNPLTTSVPPLPVPL